MFGQGGDQSIRVARAHALVDHYQRTFELVLRFWERRNSLFLILLVVLAFAAILTVLQQPITTVLTEALERQIGGDINSATKAQISENMPKAFNLLMASLVVAVFYLMANVYHRTGAITRLYEYLANMEDSIGSELECKPDSIAFTREGKFYESGNTWMSTLIGISYKGVLGSLLLSFFALRFWHDGPEAWRTYSQNGWPNISVAKDWLQLNFLFILEALIALPTAVFFVGYVTLRSSAKARSEKSPDSGAHTIGRI